MLLRLWVRRHLLARLDKGAMLVLASVTVADLTPATNLMEDEIELDFTCNGLVSGGVSSKSSSIHRSLRGVNDGVDCCFFLRRRVLTQRRKGFKGSSSSVSSSPSRFVCRSLLCITLWTESALSHRRRELEDMAHGKPSDTLSKGRMHVAAWDGRGLMLTLESMLQQAPVSYQVAPWQVLRSLSESSEEQEGACCRMLMVRAHDNTLSKEIYSSEQPEDLSQGITRVGSGRMLMI